jgi:hypothetical protein
MTKHLLTALALTLTLGQAYAQCTPCTIPFIASSQGTGNSTGVTIPIPAGVSQNDVMIAAIHVGWCNSGSAITPPAGWTLINSTSNTGSGCGPVNNTIQLATFYKVAGPSEPTSYTFTGTTNQFYVGGIVAYSGVNTIAPINASSNFGAQDACNNIIANSVTTTTLCTRLVAVFFCSVNSSLNNIVPQNSLTERVDVGTTGNHPWGNENLEISDELMTTLGPTGSKTAALNGCSSTGWVTGAQLIALTCQLSTGIEKPLLSDLLSISPNPTSGILNLNIGSGFLSTGCKEKKADIEIYNVLGKNVYTSDVKNQSTSIDLTNLPKGVYFLRVTLAEGMVTKRIVLE